MDRVLVVVVVVGVLAVYGKPVKYNDDVGKMYQKLSDEFVQLTKQVENIKNEIKKEKDVETTLKDVEKTPKSLLDSLEEAFTKDEKTKADGKESTKKDDIGVGNLDIDLSDLNDEDFPGNDEDFFHDDVAEAVDRKATSDENVPALVEDLSNRQRRSSANQATPNNPAAKMASLAASAAPKDGPDGQSSESEQVSSVTEQETKNLLSEFATTTAL